MNWDNKFNRISSISQQGLICFERMYEALEGLPIELFGGKIGI
jgi:hypothetical protein